MYKTITIVVLMMLLFGVASLADTLTLTGTSGEVFNGEAVGPYGVTVNGTLQQMVCDDLYVHVGLGDSWNATPPACMPPIRTTQDTRPCWFTGPIHGPAARSF